MKTLGSFIMTKIRKDITAFMVFDYYKESKRDIDKL